MVDMGVGSRVAAVGSALLLGIAMITSSADAHTIRSHHVARAQHHVSHVSRTALHKGHTHRHTLLHHVSYRYRHGHHHYRHYAHRGGLQCVPFARAASGIEIKGNAANWWEAADGVYARGHAPEPGSVLNFRSIGRMRLGHVAVVTDVVNKRQIEIEHANWWGGSVHGGISRNISVIDVSPDNNWTEVRVAIGHSGVYGSVYPTYGFIYDRPAGDAPTTVEARNDASAAAEATKAALEVAEAPVTRAPLGATDAPDRNLR